ERIPKRSQQGFYRDPITSEKYRSVTTILNQGVPKEALVFWAGDCVAESALDNVPALVKAIRRPQDRADMFDWLRRAHTRKKDERADVGSAVHTIIESHVLGTPLPEDLATDPEMAVFLAHFERFVADWDVTFEASEMVVANPDELYAGTLDYLVRSARIVADLIAKELLPPDADLDMCLMGDTKTGGEMCTGDARCVRLRPSAFKKGCLEDLHTIKGVYPEAGLQMSAYRAASTAWLRDGTKVPMPATHPVGIVLHLRPEGYLIHPALCDERVFDHFRYARRVADWTSETSKTVLGAPLTVPALVTEGAA
ncbi:MAG TPA: hypothetical protein VFH54_15565, partial [Mycobacteriales bacterium]|nr:hypothetical protein [Mycobacteriales bacterium]